MLGPRASTTMRIRNDFRHWESWAGLFVFGALVGAGYKIGLILGHGTLGAIIGVTVGGSIFGRVIDQVEKRYAANQTEAN